MAPATNLICFLALAAVAAPQAPSPVCEAALERHILDYPENVQLACFRGWLARGMPPSDSYSILIRARSGSVLPILEHRIEEILVSPSPLDYFTDKTVNPNKFVDFAAVVIANAGNEEALRHVAKLIQIDEKRFSRSRPVQMVLANARDFGNPYFLAYRSFEIGSPSVDNGVIDWAEQLLGDELERFSNPSYERLRRQRWEWAEAMVERYGGPPTESQWKNDPIASRLKPELAAALHDSMMRYAAETFAGRAPKP
jgi:hypothetical protein